MPKITIDGEKCKGCLLCVDVCPKGVIAAGRQLNPGGAKPAKIKQGAKCSGCCRCAVICPDCCIEVYK